MGDLVWLRRDLRRSDLPTLAEAAPSGPVTVVFVIDPVLWDTSKGTARRRWLAANLLTLRDTYEGRLTFDKATQDARSRAWRARPAPRTYTSPRRPSPRGRTGPGRRRSTG